MRLFPSSIEDNNEIVKAGGQEIAHNKPVLTCAYPGCRFCGGIGCIGCHGERKKDQLRTSR